MEEKQPFNPLDMIDPVNKNEFDRIFNAESGTKPQIFLKKLPQVGENVYIPFQQGTRNLGEVIEIKQPYEENKNLYRITTDVGTFEAVVSNQETPKLSEIKNAELLTPEDHEKLNTLLKGSEYPNSQNLSENIFNGSNDDAKYERYLEEYQTSKYFDKIKQYNRDNPNNKKFDYDDNKDKNGKEYKADVGWKLHLNISPANVEEVSKYLINNGYNHKYLSGGEIENGKIFTIYIGSNKSAKNLAQEISDDLKNVLCKPIDERETEFAPGVSARFAVTATTAGPIAQYGFKGGMPNTQEDGNKITEIILSNNSQDLKNEKIKKISRNAPKNSYIKLKEIYGKYFTG